MKGDAISLPFDWYAGFMLFRTHAIVVYYADGRTEVFDLDDPKVPLPRFRSLCPIPMN